MSAPTVVYVVGINDAIDSIWTDEERAEARRLDVHQPDKGVFSNRVRRIVLNLPGQLG